MNQIKLEKLVTAVANGLLGDGEIIGFGNDYRVTYIDLYFKDDASHTAHAELFHAGRHGDDGEGKHPNATVEEAADACADLLKSLRDWQTIAHTNYLFTIFITVRRHTIQDEATRYLYNVGSSVDSPAPDDPLIVFGL